MSAIARPFGMLLMLLYNIVNNYGVALILFAILVRVILLPFQMKSKRGMMRTTRLQPKINELQKKHGANKAKLNEEMAKMYKEEGANPASGCLWGFLPLPIMIALFLVIREPITMMMGVAKELMDLEGGGAIAVALDNIAKTHGLESVLQPYYIQIEQTRWIHTYWEEFKHFAEQGLRNINFTFLGLDLAAQPQYNFLWTNDWSNSEQSVKGLVLFTLPLLSAGSQYLSTGISRKTNPQTSPEGAGGQMKVMMMLLPLMSVYFGFIVPAALSLYWTTGTFLQIIQDVVLTRRYTRILDAEDAVRNEERIKKEAELEAKRQESERRKAEGLPEQSKGANKSKRRKQKSEKQEQLEKAAEWEKKNAPSPGEEKYEPSREGNRRYARGRAYDPDRYTRADDADGEVRRIAATPDYEDADRDSDFDGGAVNEDNDDDGYIDENDDPADDNDDYEDDYEDGDEYDDEDDDEGPGDNGPGGDR